jgi:hypothetical protein
MNRPIGPRSAFGVGFPLMNGLERGDLVLITVTCVMRAFGPIVHAAKML